jgi:hypothetical protein
MCHTRHLDAGVNGNLKRQRQRRQYARTTTGLRGRASPRSAWYITKGGNVGGMVPKRKAHGPAIHCELPIEDATRNGCPPFCLPSLNNHMDYHFTLLVGVSLRMCSGAVPHTRKLLGHDGGEPEASK